MSENIKNEIIEYLVNFIKRVSSGSIREAEVQILPHIIECLIKVVSQL